MCPEPIAALRRSQPQKITKNTLLFRDIKAAEGGAPRDVIVLIDGVEHFVGETIDLLPIMEDMAGLCCRIVTDISAKLDDGKFVGSDAPNKLALVEPARQHILPRVEWIQNKRLACEIAKKQTFANCRPMSARNIFGIGQEYLLPFAGRIQKRAAVIDLRGDIRDSRQNRLGDHEGRDRRQYAGESTGTVEFT